MAGGHTGGEDCVARRASTRLQVGTGLQSDPEGRVPGTKAICGSLDHLGLRGRPGPQAMIDVARDCATAARDRQHQQSERVGTS